MPFAKVLEGNGPNGRAIVERLVAWKDGRSDIEFQVTDGGFHVCFCLGSESIPLIHVWGKSTNQPTNQIIETRKQWFLSHLGLSEEEVKEIYLLFRRANFKRTSGPYLNLRLSYGEENNPYRVIGPEQLDKIKNALNGTIKIIQKKNGIGVGDTEQVLR